MKFSLGNLGKVKRADIELGDLTIVCGKNNMGKTYLAYSIYTFLNTIGFNLRIDLRDEAIDEIVKTGACRININDYWEDYENALGKVSPLYASNIKRFLAISDQGGALPTFAVADLAERKLAFRNQFFHLGYAIGEKTRVVFQKAPQNDEMACSFNNESEDFPEKKTLRERLSWYFSFLLNQQIFPKTHLMTGERSGISLFGTYLRQLSNDPKMQEYFKQKGDNDIASYPYPKPIMDEIGFFFKLNQIVLSTSAFGAKNSPCGPKILQLFRELAGGTYNYADGVISFVPDDDGGAPLYLPEVSSSVKALVGLNFYLKHQARVGDILMIDEPELNLHPENQRKMARLLAMLVNAGIKVFITTHSDYIVREFNALLQLNDDREYLSKLKDDQGYADNEFLDADKVRANVAENTTNGVVFNAAPVSQQDGIAIDSLDDVIDAMNQVHDAIVWGE